MLSKEELVKMLTVATETRENAFAIKSGHGFGAAILTEAGNIYGGCNVESVISSLGVCAEMAAVDHAVAHGEHNFRAVLVVDARLTWPCGACLQYLTQFAQIGKREIIVVAADTEGRTETKMLTELLPQKYESSHLEEAF